MSEVWTRHARLSAELLQGRGSEHKGQLGVAARKCMSTLSKAKQLATLVDGADAALWQSVRRGTGVPPGDPAKLLLWIVAAAIRDLQCLLRDKDMDAATIKGIKERQTSAVCVVGSLSPHVSADATDALRTDSAVRRQRDRGQALVPAQGGKRLRIGTCQ